MSDKDSLDLPRELGPYVLLRRLAVGGMAEVYVAKSRGVGDFEKLVAIKVIHPRYSEDEHFVKLLVEEAKISVLLTHVNIAQIFDLGVGDDTYYIAMEYIEGADAYRVQRRATEQKLALPIDICAFVVSEVCNGLDYAHRKRDAGGKPLRIVHRDISPQNVLLSFAGEVKLVDFGIAKAALREGQTEAGVIKGKYYYMSPEQAWGDPMDHRTDIFSTGVVLYELLTGEMLYREDNIPLLLDKVRKAEITPPERKRPEIPRELSDIIMKALSKEPVDRFQSAHEMSQALVQFLYRASPSFTSARVAELMARLFPNEIKNAASMATGAAKPAAPAPKPRPAPAPRPPPKPAAAPAATALADEDEDDATRNDLLPFRKPTAAAPPAAAAPARPAAPAPVARPAPGPPPGPATVPPPARQRPQAPAPQPVARPQADPAPSWDDDSEDETNVLDRDQWSDESTTIDDAGGVMAKLEALYGERGKPGEPKPSAPAAPRQRVPTAQPQPQPAQPPRPQAPAPQQPPPRPQAPAPQQPQVQPQSLPPQLQPQPSPPQVQPQPYEQPRFSQPPQVPQQGGGYAPSFPPAGTPSGAPWPASPPDPFAPPSGAPPFAQPPHGQRALATDVYPAQQAATAKSPWPRIVALAGLLVLAITAVSIWLVLDPGAEPVPGVIEVVSVPPGAHLRIDGHDVPGATPLRVRDAPGTPAVRHLEVTLDGYAPWSGELLPKQDELVSQVVVLTRLTVPLHVDSNPPGATLRIGNAAVGLAPIDVRVPPGPVEILVSWPGRPEVRTTVQVSAGAPAAVTLTPPP